MQADVVRVGGITPWLEIAALARAFGVPLAPHFMMELSAQLLCCLPHGHILENIDGGSITDLGALAEPIRIEDVPIGEGSHLSLTMIWCGLLSGTPDLGIAVAAAAARFEARMFEEVIRELRRLEGPQEISVPMAADPEGYLDRECPSFECLFQFKVHEDDWRDRVRDEEVFCPFCGHTADSGKWWTQEQIEHAKKAAVAHLRERIGRAMKHDADRWNRHQPRNSFLRITMKVDSRPRHVLLPPTVAESMRLKITCPECACRYAVIGTAFFCPACGHNAAELVFTQSLNGIRSALDVIGTVRTPIADRDSAETTTRLIIENGLLNAVTAFQRYAEALYSRHPSAPAARRNAFQNLAEGSDLWGAAFGKGYDAHLDAAELAALTRAFQQRHLRPHAGAGGPRLHRA